MNKSDGEVVDIYVKSEHCEDSINDIYKMLRCDSTRRPLVREILGKFQFFQNHLLHLLCEHNADKKLAFYTVMILVKLTEQPSSDCESSIAESIRGHLA